MRVLRITTPTRGKFLYLYDLFKKVVFFMVECSAILLQICNASTFLQCKEYWQIKKYFKFFFSLTSTKNVRKKKRTVGKWSKNPKKVTESWFDAWWEAKRKRCRKAWAFFGPSLKTSYIHVMWAKNWFMHETCANCRLLQVAKVTTTCHL